VSDCAIAVLLSIRAGEKCWWGKEKTVGRVVTVAVGKKVASVCMCRTAVAVGAEKKWGGKMGAKWLFVISPGKKRSR